jgi:hypothetical protein
MESNRLPTPFPQVIHQRLAEGAVLLLPSEEVYFGLNEVGAEIWALLPPVAHTFDELCDRLNAKYPDVPRATLATDVSELLQELLEQKLVSPVSVASTRADEA